MGGACCAAWPIVKAPPQKKKRTKYGVPDPYKKQEDQIKKQDEEIENLKKERLELKDQMDALLQSTASKKACWFC